MQRMRNQGDGKDVRSFAWLLLLHEIRDRTRRGGLPAWMLYLCGVDQGGGGKGNSMPRPQEDGSQGSRRGRVHSAGAKSEVRGGA